jgi:hypothetical protein
MSASKSQHQWTTPDYCKLWLHTICVQDISNLDAVTCYLCPECVSTGITPDLVASKGTFLSILFSARREEKNIIYCQDEEAEAEDEVARTHRHK